MNEIGPEALERWGLNVTKLWKDPRGRLPEFWVPWALVRRISPRVGRQWLWGNRTLRLKRRSF